MRTAVETLIKYFHHEGGETLEQIAQGDCGSSVFRHFQDLTKWDPEQLHVTGLGLSRMLDEMPSGTFFWSKLFYDSENTKVFTR